MSFRAEAKAQEANIEIIKSKIDFKIHQKYNTDDKQNIKHDTFLSFIKGASLVLSNENDHGYEHYIMIGPELDDASYQTQQVFEYLEGKDNSSACVVYTVDLNDLDNFVQMLCDSVKMRKKIPELSKHSAYKSPVEFKQYVLMTTLMINLLETLTGQKEKSETEQKGYLN